jgi:hypothetical protein
MELTKVELRLFSSSPNARVYHRRVVRGHKATSRWKLRAMQRVCERNVGLKVSCLVVLASLVVSLVVSFCGGRVSPGVG